MDELTTKDIADVLNKLADAWQDYADYCEVRSLEIAEEVRRTSSN